MTSRKAFGAVLVIIALVLGVTGVSALGQGSYQTPPTIVVKGKAKLKKGKVKVAVVICGTGTCTVTGAKAKIVAPGKRFKGKFTKSSRQPIGSGERRVLKVKVPKRARGLSKEKVKWRLTVNSTAGLTSSRKGTTKVR